MSVEVLAVQYSQLNTLTVKETYMKLKPLSYYLSLTAEAIDDVLKITRESKIKAQVTIKVAESEEELHSLNEQFVNRLTAKELDIPRVLELIDDIEIVERRVTKLQDLSASLFPPVTEQLKSVEPAPTASAS